MNVGRRRIGDRVDVWTSKAVINTLGGLLDPSFKPCCAFIQIGLKQVWGMRDARGPVSLLWYMWGYKGIHGCMRIYRASLWDVLDISKHDVYIC